MDMPATLGPYKVLSRLGAGSMGEVYRGLDPTLEREVALKVLPDSLVKDESALKRFRREALLLASVNNPNIATVFGFEEVDGNQVLVLELVEGETLDDRLARGPLDVESALKVNRQIASALEAAHRQGIIHRDLKPANVMISKDGWVKVLDFGVAKALSSQTAASSATPAAGPETQAIDLTDPGLEVPQTSEPAAPEAADEAEPETRTLDLDHLDSAEPTDSFEEPLQSPGRVAGRAAPAGVDDPNLTAAGTVLGTVSYMSPEQLRIADIDERVDIWAFGCVLYESLTGRMAFEGGTVLETVTAVSDSEPDWAALPPDLPDPVRTLLGRCLHKDRERRLHSIADARIELEDALHPFLAPDRTGPPRTGPSPSGSTTGSTTGELRSRPPGTSPRAALEYLDTLGSYTVVERLDVGAMGDVYRAHDSQMDRDVALKVLRPGLLDGEEARARFRGEAEALSRLNHPHVAALIEFGEGVEFQEGKVDFLAMEYVDGESLAMRLTRGPLSSADVARLGSQIAAGLAAAHDAGIVHRDVKPGNILLAGDGGAKLLDFGVALVADRPDAEREVKLHGPLPYAAPELVRGARANPQTDVYALGVVLYQAATGARPFGDDTAEQLANSIQHHNPPPPTELNPELDPQLEKVILRCLEKDTDARFRDARELETALEELGPALDPGGSTGSFGELLSRPAVWGSALLMIALVAFLLLTRPFGPEEVAPQGDDGVISSVVVLPGELTAGEEDSFLADAIANSISAGLLQTQGLDTKIPPSSLLVEATPGGLRRLAQAYAVEAMVVPSARVVDERLELTVQLVDAAELGIVWSGNFAGARTDYARLSREAAESLRMALRPGVEIEALPAATLDPEAESLLQRGRYYSSLFTNRGRIGDYERAQAAFEESFALDPGDGEAAAEIAQLHFARLATGVSMLEVLPEIETWANRAMEHDPRSSKAWGVLSSIESGRTPESYRRKLDFALKSATYGPRDGYSHRRLSIPLMSNSHELALIASQKASALDPLLVNGPIFEALFLTILHRTDEALAQLDAAFEVEPDIPFGRYVQSLVLTVHGEEQRALAVAEELEGVVDEGRLHPQWVAFARDIATLGVEAAAGRATGDKAREVVERLVSLGRGEVPFPRWEQTTLGITMLLARHGYRREAIELLHHRHRIEINDTYDYLLFNEELESLRDDDRVREVVSAAKERFDGMIAILEEARSRGDLPKYLEQPLSDLLARLREAA